MPKYYFDICFTVDKNMYDVDSAEKDLGFAPSRIAHANRSKNPNATMSSFSITSKPQSHEDACMLFTQYLKSVEEKLKKLKQLKDKLEGSSIEAYIVIGDHQNLPSIGLELEAINLLAQYDIAWHID